MDDEDEFLVQMKSWYDEEAPMCDKPDAIKPKRMRAFMMFWLGYTHSDEKPNFTPRQLIAAALMCEGGSDGYSLPEQVLPDLLINTFQYYHSRPCPLKTQYSGLNIFNLCQPFTRCTCAQHELVRAILEELDDISTPFATFCRKFPTVFKGRFSDGMIVLNGSHSDGSRIVRNITSEKTFDFLKLPPEIRNMVYRHVLVFEENSVALHEQHWDRRANERPCPCSDENTHAFELVYNRRPLPCVNPNQVLALLGVNRQIYAEAVPIFYGENRFVFVNLTFMHKFLKGISLFRRKAMRDVTFVYGMPGYWGKESKAARATFRLLRDCLPMKSLAMNFNEDTLIEPVSRRHGPEDIAGFKLLQTLRGFDQLLFFNCPLTEAYLRPEMSKPFVDEKELSEPQEAVPLIATKRPLRRGKIIQYNEKKYDYMF